MIIKALLSTILLFSVSAIVQTTKETSSNKDMRLKVMSYNVHHCNPPAYEKEGIIDVNGIADVIRKEKPDLIALQEIDINTGRSGKIDQAKQIATLCNYKHYYFGKTLNYDGGQYGILIISRYPLKNAHTVALPTDSAIGGEPRAIALAQVMLPNAKALYFGSTHLDSERESSSRLMQVKKIREVSSNLDEPLIIAGDFNANPSSQVIQELDKDFTRTCTKCEPTIGEDGHTDTIDFIAFKRSQNISVLDHKVISSAKGSDHFPVIAVLSVR